MSQIGKLLILAGAVFVGLGVVLLLAGKVPLLGRLPGDMHIKGEHTEVYVPLATSLLLSIILSLVLSLLVWFFARRH